MKKVIAALLVLVAIGVVVQYGCGPRTAVVSEKLLKQFDSLIGTLDIKKKSIEQKAEVLNRDLKAITERRIETEVRLENLTGKMADSQAKLAEILGKMASLKPLIEAADASETKSIEKNGKPYSAEALNKMAEDLIEQQAKTKQEIESKWKSSIDAMTRSLDFLKKQEAAGMKMMEDVKSKLEEIANKKAAIDTQRNSAILAGGESSITEKYKDLSAEIESLSVDIETQFRKEEENMKALDVNTQSVDELLREDTNLRSTLNKLDAILGTTPGGGTSGETDKQ